MVLGEKHGTNYLPCTFKLSPFPLSKYIYIIEEVC